MHYELYLPFPPSVNSYYVKTSRGLYISNKGRKFREAVAQAVHDQLPNVFISDPFLLEIVLFPPDLRIRDQDNYNKSLLDSLTVCGLWEDDSLAHQIFNYKGQKCKDGLVFMRITEAGPIIPVGGSLPMD